MRTVTEELRSDAGVPLWRHPEWEEHFPWLAQGTTGAGEEGAPFDLGLAGARPVGEVLSRWRRLREATGFATVVHAVQVHGTDLTVHAGSFPPGTLVQEGYDGHLTQVPGVLLSVAVADCVPVFLIDPDRRSAALLHAGWRGVAGGIVEGAVFELEEIYGSRPGDLWLHCGPAICGECYEVGPEVHAGVRPQQAPPQGPTPIDLRAAIGERARALGVPAEHLTVSGHCTRCGPGPFFSHRGGSRARQMGVLGRRV